MLTIRTAHPEESAQLAELAAATFPLACPPGLSADDIESFIASELSAGRFLRYTSDPSAVVVVADRDGRLVGYALLIVSEPPSTIRALLGSVRAVELSKFFLSEAEHGRGTAAELMQAVLRSAERAEADCVWLGVGRENIRANRFYEKHEFRLVGTKSFTIGGHTFPEDHVRSRTLQRPGIITEAGVRAIPEELRDIVAVTTRPAAGGRHMDPPRTRRHRP